MNLINLIRICWSAEVPALNAQILSETIWIRWKFKLKNCNGSFCGHYEWLLKLSAISDLFHSHQRCCSQSFFHLIIISRYEGLQSFNDGLVSPSMRKTNEDSRNRHVEPCVWKNENNAKDKTHSFWKLWILHTFFLNENEASSSSRSREFFFSLILFWTQFQVNTTCQQNFKLNVFVHHLASFFLSSYFPFVL